MEKLPTLPANRTLNRVLRKDELNIKGTTGELSELIISIAYGMKVIAQMVQTAGFKGLMGYTGQINASGDKTQKLDEETHAVFEQVLGSAGCFGSMLSEERKYVIPPYRESIEGKYVVAFDPLDGSSNIGTNIPIGTIFVIFKKKETNTPASESDFLRPMSDIVAAGYSVYGAKTTLVYCAGGPVRGFTLDPTLGEFILTEPDIVMPEKGSIFSVNEGALASWDARTREFVESFKKPDADRNTPYTGRYVGSLVADFDRTLKRGGVFLHPKSASHPQGKLRFIYEVLPLAYIAKKAGGVAIDGEQSISEITPDSVHARCGFIMGSKTEMGWY